MSTLAEKILEFNRNLKITARIPADIVVMEPFQDQSVFNLAQQFYSKYYNDNRLRHLIIGINPGRFGGGTTGIPFTDPGKLEDVCGIKNQLPRKTELSADFIYRVIVRFGGAKSFYGKFLFSSISPLGFTRNGKNLNYYDDKMLQEAVTPFAVNCINEQLNFGLSRDVCFCLGEGKNYDFLQKLNEKERFFGEIVPLAHPRFIMQYRRKNLEVYLSEYVNKLSSGLST